jgi:hypothetical protein
MEVTKTPMIDLKQTTKKQEKWFLIFFNLILTLEIIKAKLKIILIKRLHPFLGTFFPQSKMEH